MAPAAASAASRPAPPAGPVLVATKLHPPAAARELVPRSALLARLSAKRLPKLTLVDAPPGWGKTTLVADWQTQPHPGRRFAWLSLDQGDNDAVRFWLYVVAALRTVEPSLGEHASALLRAPAAGVVDVALAELVNELEWLEEEIVLVLDDFHAVTNREIVDQVSRLIERMPRSLRLVVATRIDPQLPLARLRALGELAELRAEDLRFTQAEAEAFVNRTLSLGLEPDDVALLHRRTEGWAAGIYLAALSLEGREDRRAFIRVFAGDDRHIVDYLVTEVLERQPERVRSFLLRTSILDRLSGPLCDAVTGTAGGARMLVEIERSNLFLVPLDTTRHWYRYHHLFADLLRHELERSEPALVPALHRRASAWHREHGSVSQAIRHAVAAGSIAEAADLVALNWNEYVNGGRSETVAAWIAALPPDAVRADARLCLAKAGASLTLGRRDEVEPWLDAAEQAPLAGDVRRGASTVEAEAAIYRAVRLYMVGEFRRATEAGRRAVELERDPASPWRAMACAALGRSLFWLGELDEAAARLDEAVHLRQGASNNLSVIGALGYLAAIEAERGDLVAAERRAAAALTMSDEQGLAEHWVALPALVARSKANRQHGDLDAARAHAERAVALGRRGAGGVELAFALLSLAAVRHAERNHDAARELVREARAAIAGRSELGTLGVELERAERTVAGRRGRVEVADRGETLSERELAVLRLLPSDRSLREIASALYVSANTVKTHTRSIYRKLSASSREEAVARARELRLL
ncbi:MAG TPA: LuxR C-terminal-related transcriptional regulator [Gaiellaceae bacterium]|nr:LuxR C-terminal-related transcriptional regulator [Gaiellaceae bacterium]